MGTPASEGPFGSAYIEEHAQKFKNKIPLNARRAKEFLSGTPRVKVQEPLELEIPKYIKVLWVWQHRPGSKISDATAGLWEFCVPTVASDLETLFAKAEAGSIKSEVFNSKPHKGPEKTTLINFSTNYEVVRRQHPKTHKPVYCNLQKARKYDGMIEFTTMNTNHPNIERFYNKYRRIEFSIEGRQAEQTAADQHKRENGNPTTKNALLPIYPHLDPDVQVLWLWQHRLNSKKRPETQGYWELCENAEELENAYTGGYVIPQKRQLALCQS